MHCGVGCRRGSDPALLWLWCRPVATAWIQPLAWEPPHALYAALEKAERQKKKKKKKKSAELGGSETKEGLQKNGQAEWVGKPGRLPGGRRTGTKPRDTTGMNVGEVGKGKA